MPIYAYRCSNCGHEEDVLQKMSDAPLSQCPACGQATYVKQVTAAGFQLKGSGWYVTDFRDGGKKSAGTDKAADAKPATDTVKTADSSQSASTGTSSGTASGSTAATNNTATSNTATTT